MEKPPRIGFVSLGCPKALVDSERILSRLHAEGYQTCNSYADADLVVVNTCGFIDSAREESLSAIGEALAENGRVIVTGCLGATPELISARHQNILAVTGPHQYDSVLNAIHDAVPPPHDPFVDLIPKQGIKLTPKHYAYLKIAEGCNHRCSFCIIPQLRGKLASRRIDEVMREAELLVASGTRELLIISQDTSAYGVDLGYAKAAWRGRELPTRLTALCDALGELGAWIRLHYVYPYPHVDELIPRMAEGTLLPYLDIPFQHASHRILKAMRRPAAEEKTLERIQRWRRAVPDLTLRSTFIVGFPGESDEDFESLLKWLEEAELDRVGCFQYEPVSGAAANELHGAVADELKEERWHRLMAAQQTISSRRLQRKVGKVISVLVDATDGTGGVGRSTGDSPEIDGKVFLRGGNLAVGMIIEAEVERAGPYDLWARPIGA
jgi:ribosomal protein S12 methylthiotransferase